MVSIRQYPAVDMSNHAFLQGLFAATAAEHSSEDLGRGHMSASWARRSAQWSSAIGQYNSGLSIYTFCIYPKKKLQEMSLREMPCRWNATRFGECFTPEKV